MRSLSRRPAILLFLFTNLAAQAATKSWTGAVNNLWSVGGNWSGGVAPVNGDDLLFPGASAATATNDLAGLTIGAITVSS